MKENEHSILFDRNPHVKGFLSFFASMARVKINSNLQQTELKACYLSVSKKGGSKKSLARQSNSPKNLSFCISLQFKTISGGTILEKKKLFLCPWSFPWKSKKIFRKKNFCCYLFLPPKKPWCLSRAFFYPKKTIWTRPSIKGGRHGMSSKLFFPKKEFLSQENSGSYNFNLAFNYRELGQRKSSQLWTSSKKKQVKSSESCVSQNATSCKWGSCNWSRCANCMCLQI